MTSTFLQKGTLALSGLLALGIGAAILFAPTAFYALSAVTLPNDVNLLNDIRAFGGGLIAAAIFISLGLIQRSLILPSLTAAAIIFAGFGLARVWSISVDGVPDATYVWVLIIELFVAALAALAGFRTSNTLVYKS